MNNTTTQAACEAGDEAMTIKKFKDRKTRCKTCPFNPDDFYGVRNVLLGRIFVENGMPLCHTVTGIGDSTEPVPANKNVACRGAKDVANKHFFEIGFIEAATDEAWDKKAKEMAR